MTGLGRQCPLPLPPAPPPESRPPSAHRDSRRPARSLVASTRPRATGTAEFAGNEDVAVGEESSSLNRRRDPDWLPRPPSELRGADQLPDRFGRRSAHDPQRLSANVSYLKAALSRNADAHLGVHAAHRPAIADRKPI
jgi:hypothetical protein